MARGSRRGRAGSPARQSVIVERSLPQFPATSSGRRSSGHRVAAERRDEEEPLAVRRRDVRLRDVPRRDASRNRAPAECPPGSSPRRPDLDRHELLVERAVEELFPVGAPARVASPRRRDLPLAARLRESSGRRSRRGRTRSTRRRRSGRPARTRGFDSRNGVARIAIGFPSPNSRKRPDVPARLRVLALIREEYGRRGDQSIANLDRRRLEEQLLLARSRSSISRRGRTPRPGPSVKTIVVAVGRPDGANVVALAEREPRVDAAREVADPDVRLAGASVGEVEREAVAGRRKMRGRRTRRDRRACRAPFPSGPARAGGRPTRRCGRRGRRCATRRSGRARRCRCRSSRPAGPALPWSSAPSRRRAARRASGRARRADIPEAHTSRASARERAASSPSSRSSRSSTRCPPASGRSTR